MGLARLSFQEAFGGGPQILFTDHWQNHDVDQQAVCPNRNALPGREHKKRAMDTNIYSSPKLLFTCRIHPHHHDYHHSSTGMSIQLLHIDLYDNKTTCFICDTGYLRHSFVCMVTCDGSRMDLVCNRSTVACMTLLIIYWSLHLSIGLRFMLLWRAPLI